MTRSSSAGSTWQCGLTVSLGGSSAARCALEEFFDHHNTGKGWVKGKQGEYHDALFNKNNRVEIVLHENLGGGFSPPAAQKMRRNGRKAKDHGVDRTPYQGDRKISYVSYHTRAISMGITKAESRTLIDAAHHAKGRLCRMRVGAPAALA